MEAFGQTDSNPEDFTSMREKPFVSTPIFYGHFGKFYAVWSQVELNIDFAIGNILKASAEQTHALVAGMQFGRKAALLRTLLPNSNFSNVPELKGYLTRIRKNSLRNVFTHSLVFSNPGSVTFVHRSSQGEYSADGYRFTADQFVTHVKDFVQLAADFEKALNIPYEELNSFAKAALPRKNSQPAN
jgi:hypothetical protein